LIEKYGDRSPQMVSALAVFAKQAPQSPIILDAHDSDSYEALNSIPSYVNHGRGKSDLGTVVFGGKFHGHFV
jgi:hypothetical protein